MNSAIDLLKRSIETQKRAAIQAGEQYEAYIREAEEVKEEIAQYLQSVAEMEKALKILETKCK